MTRPSSPPPDALGARKLRVLDLFAGIGGFSLGLERTGGFETVAFCEIEPFCQKVLAKHWPGVPCYDDVRELTAERLAADGIVPDVITGGFPCQDISVAGKGAGIADGTRSGLWSEIARLAGELRPRYVVVENVAALLSGPGEQPGGWFGRVLGDLAALGFDAEWHCIPAAYVGAPHRRDRAWLVAYPASERRKEAREYCERSAQRAACGREVLADADSERRNGCAPAHSGNQERAANDDQQQGENRDVAFADMGGPMAHPDSFAPVGAAIARQERRSWPPEPSVGRVVDGIPERVVRPQLTALGNAVVPAIPELIGNAILHAEAHP